MRAWVYWLGYVPFLLDVPHYKIPLTFVANTQHDKAHNSTKHSFATKRNNESIKMAVRDLLRM
jgi:hypothetical protein